MREKELLQNGILQDLGRTQTDNGLGLDLDRFAGLGIAAHAGFAMSLYDAADTRDNKLPRSALGFLDGQLVELIKESDDCLLRGAGFLGEMRNDFGFAQWLSCHFFCLSSLFFYPPRDNRGQPRAGKTPIFLQKTRAEPDYSEGRKGTQGQMNKKGRKTAIFLWACAKRADFMR
jgi:hypothetical protein